MEQTKALNALEVRHLLGSVSFPALRQRRSLGFGLADDAVTDIRYSLS